LDISASIAAELLFIWFPDKPGLPFSVQIKRRAKCHANRLAGKVLRNS
jgi:hypothetical protein